MLEPQSAGTQSETDGISFFNRDHVISVTIHQGEIAVTTTAGPEIKIPASPATISRFADELTMDVQSNFVSIATTTAGTDTVQSLSCNSWDIFPYKLFLNPDFSFRLALEIRDLLSVMSWPVIGQTVSRPSCFLARKVPI
jgi:hypothetical protein